VAPRPYNTSAPPIGGRCKDPRVGRWCWSQFEAEVSTAVKFLSKLYENRLEQKVSTFVARMVRKAYSVRHGRPTGDLVFSILRASSSMRRQTALGRVPAPG